MSVPRQAPRPAWVSAVPWLVVAACLTYLDYKLASASASDMPYDGSAPFWSAFDAGVIFIWPLWPVCAVATTRLGLARRLEYRPPQARITSFTHFGAVRWLTVAMYKALIFANITGFLVALGLVVVAGAFAMSAG